MRSEGFEGHNKERHHRGKGHMKKVHDRYQHGAKTFRRGRAITFLERMELKRATLQQQLVEPALQSINPILVGELKAIEMVISEFVDLFELYDRGEKENQKMEEDETSLSVTDEIVGNKEQDVAGED